MRGDEHLLSRRKLSRLAVAITRFTLAAEIVLALSAVMSLLTLAVIMTLILIPLAAIDDKVLASLLGRSRKRIPVLLCLGAILVPLPRRPLVITYRDLLVEEATNILERDPDLLDARHRLIANAAQRINASGVDALDGAHEAKLALKRRDHGPLLRFGSGRRKGGEAKEMAQVD